MSRHREATEEKKSMNIAEKARMTLANSVDEELDRMDSGSADDGMESEEKTAESTEESSEDCKKELTPEQRVWEELYDENGIRVELKLSHMDLYAFLMHHSYLSLTGIIGLLLSLYCLARGILEVTRGETDSMTAVLLLIGVWYILISPLSMLGKAATQMKTNPSLQQPITYLFTGKGMLQEQGEVRTGCKWNMITKVVFSKRIWILYAGKVRGTILPVAQLGEYQEELKALIKAHTGKKK